MRPRRPDDAIQRTASRLPRKGVALSCHRVQRVTSLVEARPPTRLCRVGGGTSDLVTVLVAVARNDVLDSVRSTVGDRLRPFLGLLRTTPRSVANVVRLLADLIRS